MKKISKEEYEAALKIVNAYKAQDKPKHVKSHIVAVRPLSGSLSFYSDTYDFSKLNGSALREITNLKFVFDVSNDDGDLDIGLFNTVYSKPQPTEEEIDAVKEIISRYIKVKEFVPYHLTTPKV